MPTYTPAQLAVLKAQYEAGGVFETGLRAVGPIQRPLYWWPPRPAQKLQWPQIDSGFGDRLNSEGAERDDWLWHLGTDWHLALGAPIVAISDGTVTAAIPATDPAAGERGTTVIHTVEHGYALSWPGEIIRASYTHLQRFTVAVGQRVRRGEVIGYVGQSGPTRVMPHLHLNITSSRSVAQIIDPVTHAHTNFSYRYDFLQLLSGDMRPINPVNPPARDVPIRFMDQAGTIYPASATVIWPFVCRMYTTWRFWPL